MRIGPALLLAIAAAGLSGQNASHSGIHPEDMDPTCKPCTDFWRYVNGGWLDKNNIPADKASWGPAAVLADANRERIRTILEAAAADSRSALGSDRRKMGDFYTACMDTAAIDTRGIAPLQPDFDRIAAIRTTAELVAVLAGFQRMGRPFGAVNGAVVGAFRLTSGQDAKNPDRVVARIVERDAAGRTGSAIFSLPDRDYYFRDDDKSKQIRGAFLEHAAKLLERAGTPHAVAADQAQTILNFEKTLAESVMTIADKRDPDKTYHPMDLAGLRALAPNFDWALLLREAGLPESTAINVSEPELLKKVNQELTSAPLETWKVWLRWRDLQLSAPYLARPFAEESFHFQSAVLTGIQQAPPRWETCAGYVDRDLSDALGKAYTEKYFPPEAKRRMGALVENLRAALREQMEQSEWMQPETKKLAIAKLNALQVQIGYPDAWHDYSALRIARNDFFADVRAAWTWGDDYEISKIGKPVSHVDWAMTAPTVNAYSNAAEVKVVFPAGILQPPFFDMQADDAVNYGGIGTVIGHEIGHQFDDGGSKFDATGALKNWWTDEDRKKFETRTGCVVDQFNSIDVGAGLHHNGKQVLGEALGDLGGVSVAYRAYQRSLGGKPGPVLDGFTSDQRFFIAFARLWGTKMREEAVRLQLNTNNHPLAQWRATATLQNMPEFHKAFQCKAGDAMVRPADRQCRLW
jgi:predicted metalloendopeptidase